MQLSFHCDSNFVLMCLIPICSLKKSFNTMNHFNENRYNSKTYNENTPMTPLVNVFFVFF